MEVTNIYPINRKRCQMTNCQNMKAIHEVGFRLDPKTEEIEYFLNLCTECKDLFVKQAGGLR